jgi:hypothetical protein
VVGGTTSVTGGVFRYMVMVERWNGESTVRDGEGRNPAEHRTEDVGHGVPELCSYDVEVATSQQKGVVSVLYRGNLGSILDRVVSCGV